eukprot:TRINITY_DN2732_c0_g1_i31.p3 TRINITY_DN2732_c0_g1~~TRINITY_DN2732_c0_g1_i31.p3  ORF type:complete len:125 (+),score=22.60 TRINITY_DN2732_c0_g1_i31:1172-1546(+)
MQDKVKNMVVLIPKIKEDGSIALWKPIRKTDHLIRQYENGYTDNMFCFTNKKPVWSILHKGYFLKFEYRPALPSVKNFLLVSSSNQEEIIMQLGKQDDNLFNMVIKWPLSIFQGFGIALTSFDY